MCKVREWNLSFECLTGPKMRAALRDMKNTDPTFWAELTQSTKKLCPDEAVAQPEDEIDELEDLQLDDSNIPIELVVENMVLGTCSSGVLQQDDGGLMSVCTAENVDLADGSNGGVDEGEKKNEEKPMGVGKRERKPNKWYNSKDFWKH